MTKKTLTIVLVAILLAGAATVAIAATLVGGSDDAPNHAMPNGTMMDGDSMGSNAGTGSHSMSDGPTMGGESMPAGE